MRRARLALASVAIAAVVGAAFATLGGCVIADVSLDGKHCPCASPGWSCDTASDRCVKIANADMAVSGAFRVSNLSVRWVTPTQMLWTWTADGEAADFKELRFVLGRTMQDVATGTDVTILDRTTNPELGELYLRHSRTLDPANQLITRGLTPDTDYYGQLFAVDTTGATTATAIVGQHTAVPTTDLLSLYSDQTRGPCGGWFEPPEIMPSAAAPLHPGGTAISYSAPCGGDGGRSCYQNLQVGCPTVKFPVGFNINRFTTTAYLELYLAVDTQPTSDWMSIFLMLSDESTITFEPFTVLANGQYTAVQVPLAGLTWHDAARQTSHTITYADLVDPSTQQLRTIKSFAVGGEWASGSTVRIDEVAIHF